MIKDSQILFFILKIIWTSSIFLGHDSLHSSHYARRLWYLIVNNEINLHAQSPFCVISWATVDNNSSFHQTKYFVFLENMVIISSVLCFPCGMYRFMVGKSKRIGIAQMKSTPLTVRKNSQNTSLTSQFSTITLPQHDYLPQSR